MALVRVKDKYQVTIPNDVRLRTGVAVGDYPEAKRGRGGVITITITRRASSTAVSRKVSRT
jgi:bifunctional DNA-binding transcriptional regulator/antitoxin component of YhaV-PrlF toxin-antitoxin module